MGNRLAGLDLWRALLLHFGVVLHGAVLIRTLPGASPAYAWIEGASRITRMQAFFLIAGFLAARVLSSRDPQSWIRTRAIQLVIPLVFVWATVSRLTSWLLTGDPFTDITSPDHLWFLIVLLAFSLLTFGLENSAMRPFVGRVIAAADKASGASFMVTLLVVVFGAIIAREMLLMAFPTLAVGAHPYRGLNLISRGMVMIWFYLAGFVLGRSSLLSRLSVVPVTIAAALSVLVYLAIKNPNDYGAIEIAHVPRKAMMLAMHCTSASGSVFFALAVLTSAARIRTVPKIVSRLAEASYTLYLMHLFFLSLCFAALSPLGLHREVLFTIMVICSSSLSIATHFAARRVPALFFLLNGVRPGKGNSNAAPAIAGAAA